MCSELCQHDRHRHTDNEGQCNLAYLSSLMRQASVCSSHTANLHQNDRHRQAHRQMTEYTDRQTDGQTDGQTDRRRVTNTD